MSPSKEGTLRTFNNNAAAALRGSRYTSEYQYQVYSIYSTHRERSRKKYRPKPKERVHTTYVCTNLGLHSVPCTIHSASLCVALYVCIPYSHPIPTTTCNYCAIPGMQQHFVVAKTGPAIHGLCGPPAPSSDGAQH